MAKQRKRTNKNVPAKGRLRDIADQLWSLAVRSDWDHRCAVCGNGNVEAHHLVPRQFTATRHVIKNGIALCPNCHKFDPIVSPHLNAAGWIAWLGNHYPYLREWYFLNQQPVFEGTTNALYYCDIIWELREYFDEGEWERTAGIRFATWLEEQNSA